jgi:GNAT superfamily N-acetyltransferase
MRIGDVELISARSLRLSELTALFNSSYSDYAVPLAFDEDGLQRHVSDNDIDLGASLVVLAPGPVGFALIARRGREAWVGGMGTVPQCRRRGFAERTLNAVLEAAGRSGAETVWLEVLEDNRAAISLYQQLGFEVTRQLIVCSLREPLPPRTDCRPMRVDDARRWIAKHRTSREPWQRADPVLARMTASGRPLAAVGIPDSSGFAAALVYAEGTAGTNILQMVARDESAAAGGLCAAATAAGGPVLLVNFPADEPVAAGVARLGIRPDHIQHEMQLRLATSPK